MPSSFPLGLYQPRGLARLPGWLSSVAIGLLLIGCGSSQPVRIGIVLDADGERGAASAVAEINASGGVRGRLLELRALHGFASTLAKDALEAADSLARDDAVVAVVGHTNSSASLAAAQIYNEQRIVQIAPTSTTPLYSEVGQYSFRLAASDIHQGAFLAKVLAGTGEDDRTAVLYVNDDYGRALHRAFVSELSARGVVPVYEAPYGDGPSFIDADQLARAVGRARPRTLVWLGRAPELTVLLPKLRQLVPNLSVLASDGFAGLPSETGEIRELVGVRYVRFLDLETSSGPLQKLLGEYQRRWGEQATDQAVLSYEAVKLIAAAIQEVGPDREAIRGYLSELGSTRAALVGVTGPLAFDERGDPMPVYYLAEVTTRGSRTVRLGPAGQSP
jgi:branched-chain amino acid transport system substrate-binding protein